MRLSRQTVSGLTLPPGKSEIIVFDEALPGFGLRIRAGGKRVWIAQYRMGAKQRRITIGSAQAIDPDEARRRAKEVLAHAQLGKDPQADKAESKAKAALTLRAVVERYLGVSSSASLSLRIKGADGYVFSRLRQISSVSHGCVSLPRRGNGWRT